MQQEWGLDPERLQEPSATTGAYCSFLLRLAEGPQVPPNPACALACLTTETSPNCKRSQRTKRRSCPDFMAKDCSCKRLFMAWAAQVVARRVLIGLRGCGAEPGACDGGNGAMLAAVRLLGLSAGAHAAQQTHHRGQRKHSWASGPPLLALDPHLHQCRLRQAACCHGAHN